ncbi:MAG: Gfo/Idh/MocA family oxidoreductase [Kiritimatiellae bacterium]|nr:Gfo/Idh/MocA family oxidoreductase [Kiritimatiellia bacterium]
MKIKRGHMRGRVIRFGVIGVGGMGCGHCASITRVKQARLTAVYDIDPATAEKVGKQFNVPYFLDYRQLIKAGLCDAIIIATPHPSHAPIAIDCMNAGLHVISEKPLSERVSMADKMVQAAKKNRVAFAVMFQRRFEPVIAKALAIVKSGQIGKIYRTCMISPEFRSQAYYDSGTWRATWAGEGGGVMMNQSPHIMDIFIQLCGMPSEVYGRTETRMHRIEVEDLAEALLKYPNGGTGYLYCSTNESGPGQMIEIFGEKGKLVFRNGGLKLYRFKPGIQRYLAFSKKMWGAPDTVEVPLKIPEKKSGHASVIANLVRHLLYGEQLFTPGESGVASLELANAIMLSSRENRWVKLPISRVKYDALLTKLQRVSKFVKQAVQVKRITDPHHKA